MSGTTVPARALLIACTRRGVIEWIHTAVCSLSLLVADLSCSMARCLARLCPLPLLLAYTRCSVCNVRWLALGSLDTAVSALALSLVDVAWYDAVLRSPSLLLC